MLKTRDIPKLQLPDKEAKMLKSRMNKEIVPIFWDPDRECLLYLLKDKEKILKKLSKE